MHNNPKENNIEQFDNYDDYNTNLLSEDLEDYDTSDLDSLNSLNLLEEDNEDIFLDDITSIQNQNLNISLKNNIQNIYKPTDDFLSKPINFFLTKKVKLTNNKKSVNKLMVFLDTEYESDVGLSIQVAFYGNLGDQHVGGKFILIDKIYKNCFNEKLKSKFESEEKSILYFVDIKGNLDNPLILEYILKNLNETSQVDFNNDEIEIYNISIRLFFYYTLQDLNISFGRETMGTLYSSKDTNLKQRNNVVGSFKLSYAYQAQTFNFAITTADLSGLQSESLLVIFIITKLLSVFN
jgi:hypothetical protein